MKLNLTGRKPRIPKGPARPKDEILEDYREMMRNRTDTVHVYPGSTTWPLGGAFTLIDYEE